MKCQYCNSKIPENAVVCPVCGAISPGPGAVNTEPVMPEAPRVQQMMAAEENITPFTALKKYAVFSGRARRKEFWLFKLLTFSVMMVGQLVLANVVSSPVVLLVAGVISLLLIVPEIAVFCRRMHDVGKSGLMWFWNLLPLAGLLIPIPGSVQVLSLISTGILLFYELKDSQPGTNKYGPNPKGK